MLCGVGRKDIQWSNHGGLELLGASFWPLSALVLVTDQANVSLR